MEDHRVGSIIRRYYGSISVGIDVGSTTTKIVAIDSVNQKVLFSRYIRHHARQAESVCALLEHVEKQLRGRRIRAALCGSGGSALATTLGLPYVQEVVANSLAVRSRYGQTRTAIELGGQDAKMIFFAVDQTAQEVFLSDMRMNGACAGGTGAFIDEIASLLKVPVESFSTLARNGVSLYNISGRCGVFAKTDIQPLLNQGVSKEDIALSSFHAIAKQTIGGLAQGMDIEAPVMFSGGPLTFNPELIRVFAQRLDLSEDDIIIPQHPETFVALGAALSLDELFRGEHASLDIGVAQRLLSQQMAQKPTADNKSAEIFFFENDTERRKFEERHELGKLLSVETIRNSIESMRNSKIRAYLGIDSGSTTTKLALINEDGDLIDSFYAPNKGEPLDIARTTLQTMHEKFDQRGIDLEIISVGTTGYGELLFAKAFGADYHVVETVAHMKAAQTYEPNVSFILDIGGQDMKAIWVEKGVITNIIVNEACSSGCGSFLESLASSLNISVEEISEAAFSSQNPALLGSRCTVFMNSSIVTEQKNGKTPEDIMAGLCHSIIENVFTKVVRVKNSRSLGDHIVVQGGTFLNDAVLRAFEQYIGKEVTRAPYPGMMGAIGVALLAQEHTNALGSQATFCDEVSDVGRTNFIGLNNLENFEYQQTTNLVCPFCANQCSRTRIEFSNGSNWVTGNRCSKGELMGDPQDESVRKILKHLSTSGTRTPNLFDEREKLLFKDYPFAEIAPQRDIVMGLPRVLAFWETMPFWKTFFRSLGFSVKISHPSDRKMYERGLQAITSDTVCFPAKLAHGHIRDLVDQGVHRIFMPSITTVQSENTENTSESMCAVVKGYPIVVRNSDNPKTRWNVHFDDPLFHWYSNHDRDRQLADYMSKTFGIEISSTHQAIAQADSAQLQFQQALEQRGCEVLEQVAEEGRYAVILASRPYQNDPLVNHDLPQFFTDQGIPVLSVDSVPGIREVDLSGSRLDIVNNYHARMLSASLIAAQSSNLEYVQIVSFGCGHDAYLSDEIVRLMKETSDKAPLVLKLDESSIQGPLRIRIRSFIETIRIKRKEKSERGGSGDVERNGKWDAEGVARGDGKSDEKWLSRDLPDPYPVKYTKEDVHERTVLVPNTSHAFCRLMTAAFRRQGLKVEPLPVGREDAIRLGKKYVHNDICFPAQTVIGEALAALHSGNYDNERVAIGMGKYIGDCRLTHYSALLRKALDDAGFENVPIITNDADDSHNLHPGFKMSIASAAQVAIVLPMIDVLEELLRKIRPYETAEGAASRAFENALDYVIEGLEKSGVRGAVKGFEQAINVMKSVEYDRRNPNPQVLIVGEYLLNFHPGANNDIEDYLERNGLEIIEARMTDVIRKTYFYKNTQIKEYGLDKPVKEKLGFSVADNFFEIAHDITDRIAKAHPLYEPALRMPEMVKSSDSIVHHTFDAGEGVLIPGEILHHAEKGCRAFVILQPFGCLPNHIVGRGIVKRLKELYPETQILALDYDPDVSFANIENRLQMMIMNVHMLQEETSRPEIINVNDDYREDDYNGGLPDENLIDWEQLLDDSVFEETPVAAMEEYQPSALSNRLRDKVTVYTSNASSYVSDAAATMTDAATSVVDAATSVTDAATGRQKGEKNGKTQQEFG